MWPFPLSAHAEDIRTLRRYLCELGSFAKIIAKIEDQAGVRNMVEIIREADGLMVARGDLGIEIDYYRLPLVQTEMIRACEAEGKPVIIATHLLETMIASPMPTRAEISDVCSAIREKADAVMLSGETTIGAYPLESVQVMKNIIESIEPTVSGDLNTAIQLNEPKSKMLRSAAQSGSGTGRVRYRGVHPKRIPGPRPGGSAGARGADLMPSRTSKRYSTAFCCPGAWSLS